MQTLQVEVNDFLGACKNYSPQFKRAAFYPGCLVAATFLGAAMCPEADTSQEVATHPGEAMPLGATMCLEAATCAGCRGAIPAVVRHLSSSSSQRHCPSCMHLLAPRTTTGSGHAILAPR